MIAATAEQILNDASEKTESFDFAAYLENKTKYLSETKPESNRALRRELLELGPIETLLKDQAVDEIIADRFDSIWVEKQGLLQKHHETFLSPLTFDRIVEKIKLDCGISVDYRIPFADGNLSDGSRVHIISSPITLSPILTIRKHKSKAWDLEKLSEQKLFSQPQHQILANALTEKKNILIVGATGSGKTTLLRALMQATPTQERIVVLEDTSELYFDRPNTAFLKTRIDLQGTVPDIDLSGLIKNSLRMRPDRIVVGEVRGEEALYLLDAISTGHGGSMCTLHASSASQALKRLEALVLRKASQWNVHSVRQLIHDGIDLVVVVQKNEKGARLISEIARPSGIEDFGILVESL